MAITKHKKIEIVKKVKNSLAGAPGVVFVNFHGLTVKEAGKLREDLKESGCSYMVAKKTLIRKALEEVKPRGEIPPLDGEVAIAWGEDPIAPAREIHKHGKEFEDRVGILGGIFENSYRSKDEMVALATIPGREILLAQFLNVINAPVSGFVTTLNNTVGSLVQVLGQIQKVKS